MAKYQWKSPETYQKAYQWVMSEQARITKGKTISNTKNLNFLISSGKRLKRSLIDKNGKIKRKKTFLKEL